MTIDDCIDILTYYNAWRCVDVAEPDRLGEAIDFAIEELHRMKGLEK